jgi:MobA/VirD2-like, nuclease domain
MHIKFCSGGKNKVSRVVNYVTGKKDANGNIRLGVTVLRGDPKSVIAVGSGLSFETKYSAAIIAFHQEDQPTDEEINEVLDQFEKTCFAGLDRDRFSFLSVRHDEEKGGCHIHVVINKVDLKTGKHFNPAPPGWMTLFDPLRDHFNYKYGWVRPDDPKRKRPLQLGNMTSVIKHVNPKIRLTRAHVKQNLHTVLHKRVKSEQIQDRNEMIEDIKELGFKITRKGENYLTVIEENSGHKFRLKGKIYEEQYYIRKFKKTRSTSSEDHTNRRKDFEDSNSEKAKASYQLYVERLQKKSKDNQKRYNKPKSEIQKRSNSNIKKSSISDLVSFTRLELTYPSGSIRPALSVSKNKQSRNESENIVSTISSSSHANQRGYISDFAVRETNDLSIWQSISHQIIKLTGDKYESIRNRIINRIGAIVEAICFGAKRNQQTHQSIDAACEEIDDCLSGVEEDIRCAELICNDNKAAEIIKTNFKI